MKVALTGATGFLGRHTVAALVAAGHEVVPLSRSGRAVAGVAGLAADVCQRAQLDAAFVGCDAVIHAAGKVSHDPSFARELWDVHVVGTEHALGAAVDAGVGRFVHVSTSGTRAVSQDPTPATEASPDVLPTIQAWPYYRSKYFAEDAALAAASHGLDVVVLNPALLLGPGDDPHGPATSVVRMFLDDGVPLPPPGGPCFVDVRDVAQACVAALSQGQTGQAYLLGGCNLSWRALYDRLARMTGRPPPLATLPKLTRKVLGFLPDLGGEDGVGLLGPKLSHEEAVLACYFWYCDSSAAREALGFAPRDPSATLADTVSDIESRRRRWA